MNGIVVYESHWGNTKVVARAIAAGLGEDARAVTTDEVSEQDLAAADIVVVGAPVIAFGLVKDEARAGLVDDRKAPRPADVEHPSMRSWLGHLPRAGTPFAAFETRIWWSPRGATGTIESRLSKAGTSASRRPSVSSSPVPTDRSEMASSNGLATGANASSRRSRPSRRHPRPDFVA